MLPVDQVNPVLGIGEPGVDALLKAGKQQVDIAQHVVDPPPGGPQHGDLAAADGLGLLQGQLRVRLVLLRLMHVPHNVFHAPVSLQNLRLYGVKVPNDQIGHQPKGRGPLQTGVHGDHLVKPFIF